MAKLKTLHRCVECGGETPRWVGRCPSCGSWNSLVEEVEAVFRAGAGPAGQRAAPNPPVLLADVDAGGSQPWPTGIGELDRVLGGGLVPGSVTVLTGEPGIGKSTLLLQALSGLGARGRRGLLVTAEEASQQVRIRAERLGLLPAAGTWIVSETALPGVLGAIDEVTPDVVVVDSIQTVFEPELGSAPGSVAQVKECAHQLVQMTKRAGVATVLVGHVTKDGTLAGPRVLEHVVDTVLSFEGERHHALRVLRAFKHRFGATGELGLFEMGDDGLHSVPDAGGLLLADRHPGAAGSVVLPAVEGHRPLLVEIQALVAQSELVQPRRSAQGLDAGRLALVLAVLARHVRLPLTRADVYVCAVGGVRVVEPAADLPLALALVSALTRTPLAADLVACGEVGLGGELRQVGRTDRRLAEAARLGFTRALVALSAPPGIEVLRAATLEEAVSLVGLRPKVVGLRPTLARPRSRSGPEGTDRASGPSR